MKNLLGQALWTLASGVIVSLIVQAVSGQPAAAAAAGTVATCTCAALRPKSPD